MNFQAAVTAIAAIHVARGRPLQWLDGVVEDIPVALSAETGGSGDDVRLQFRDDTIAEVQIKRGLAAGDRLWEPLLALSGAIHSGAIDYGVLAVSPTSSGTIRDRLARDIVRIGDGRDDNLGPLAIALLKKLAASGLPAGAICQCLRIVTINALSEDAASIAAARAELAHLCHDENRVGDAWNRLYRDSGQLIEKRGRRTASTVLRVLQSGGIELAAGTPAGPVALLPKLIHWVAATSAEFSILGAERSLTIDKSWIPLKAVVREEAIDNALGLAEALNQYHNWTIRGRRDRYVIDTETIGRFIQHAVVVAGPGMGKSVLQKKLARCYTAEGYPVLRVNLAFVAARMRATGSTFTESLFELGLNGFELPSSDVVKASLSDWVLLCDGLDECGADQDRVAQGIHDYVSGHPHCRFVVTTRPVGYRSTILRAWRHYEIIPLENSGAQGHLGNLIADIAPAGSSLVDTAWEIAGAALKSSKAESVIARSPLLLGMAAVILTRGKTLGRSKAELYLRMFELIDQTPNTRKPEPPSTPAVLNRFLDILGWNVGANPAAQTTEFAASCSDALAIDLQMTPLRARELAEKCIDYWEAAGTIERVRHGHQETLTFIHKTFGEFAAARFLTSAAAQRETLVASILDKDEWAEVINFAASLGLADLIASAFITDLRYNREGSSLIRRALDLTAEAEPPPELETRRRIIEAAFEFVKSNRRQWSFAVGDSLVPVAERFPAEVGAYTTGLLESAHPWTRTVAWTCAVIAGPEFYDREEMVKQLEAIPGLAEPGIRVKLSGGIELGGGNIGILQPFLVAAVDAVLEFCPPDVADRIVPAILNDGKVQTWATFQKITALLKKKGKTYSIKLQGGDLDWTKRMSGPEGYAGAQRLAYQKTLAAIIQLDPAVEADPSDAEPNMLLHLSAFLKLTLYLEMPAYDVWSWRKPYDETVVLEVMRGIVGIIPVDQARLIKDSYAFLRRLAALPDDDIFKMWQYKASVDVPELDEQRLPGLNLRIELLEKGLYHPSVWIVQLATHLYLHVADASNIKATAVRAFAAARGITLSAASRLAEQLGEKTAIEIACDRLTKPLVSGCEHIFNLLRRLKVKTGRSVLAVLENGLMTGDEDTAVSAASLAEEMASGEDNKQLLAIICNAYDYWLKHEKPYPTGGGVVPTSPREKLLLGRLKMGSPSVEALLAYSRDLRSDVSKVGLDAMIERLQASPEARSTFVQTVLAGQPNTRVLSAALHQKVPFLSSEVDRLCKLFEADDATVRFAALGLLSENYLAKEQIEAFGKVLVGDKNPDVREGVFRALDQLLPRKGPRALAPVTPKDKSKVADE